MKSLIPAFLASVLLSTAAWAQEGITHYVRYARGNTISYGILEGETVKELQGSLFENPKPTGRSFALSEVKLLIPVEPQKVLGVAGNYVWLGQAPRTTPRPHPRWFAKLPTVLGTPESDVEMPPEASNLDWEGELVLVMGKKARHVSAAEATRYIFGVTVGNDISENTWYGERQGDNEPSRLISKSTDTWGPIGRSIVTGLDYRDLGIEVRLNGQLAGKGRTSQMLNSPAQLVSYLSRYMTLMPGDLIFTGTVARVPNTADDLKVGDVVEVEIEKVGKLRNKVVPFPASARPAPAVRPAVRLNRTIDTLSQGKPVFGIFSGDRSLDNARALARSDLDYVIIDMEHGPFDTETLRTFLLGMIDRRQILTKANLQPNVTPIVRIAANGREQLQFLAKQVLDVGAFGVMFPYVNNRAEAENAVRAARYPQKKGVPDAEPMGLRGHAPGNAVWYWGLTPAEYTDRADVWPLDPNGEVLSVIQIETAEAVRNVEEILSVPGISAIFIGPSDLSCSLGYCGNPEVPEVEEAIQRVLKACLARKIPVGLTTGADSVEKRIRQGFSFVTVGGDGGISPGTATALQKGRAAAGR